MDKDSKELEVLAEVRLSIIKKAQDMEKKIRDAYTNTYADYNEIAKCANIAEGLRIASKIIEGMIVIQKDKKD